jgi:multidrug efflux pump subunit AcrA (membrane-fusion protein)
MKVFKTNIFKKSKTFLNNRKNWFLRTSWKKKILVIIIFLILILVIKNIFFKGSNDKYTYDTVGKGKITQFVTETGNVTATNETDVFSPTTGVLDEIFVKNGDEVGKGDKLFTVRSTATPQEQAVANANYEAAVSAEKTAQQNKIALQASLEQQRAAVISAQSAVDRMNSNVGGSKNNPDTGSPYTQNDKDVINSNLTSARETFSAIEQKYNDANTAIGAAQAQVSATFLAYQATQNTTITAPTSGIVSNIIGLSGAKVVAQQSSAATANTSTSANAAATLGTVTPVLIIGNSFGHSIQTTVSEVDVNKIKLGQHVEIVFGAIPNKTYSGHIVQIDTYGTNTAGVITYNIFILIDSSDTNIRPNMTANLTINTAEKDNVLTVANSAVVPYQNGKAVQVLDKNKKVKFIPVKIGLRGFARSEILSGVQNGIKVILGNTQTINNTAGGPQATQ